MMRLYVVFYCLLHALCSVEAQAQDGTVVAVSQEEPRSETAGEIESAEEGNERPPEFRLVPPTRHVPIEQVASQFSAYDGNIASNNDPRSDKCRAAGYHPHMFEQDEYELTGRLGGGMAKTNSASCKSASANSRGLYTSYFMPCAFQFYSIPGEKETDLDPFVMSTACTANKILTKQPEVEEYVVKFPDECVADFMRCYHLERDEKILLRHICKYDWVIPKGTTHVSVDCTANKAEAEDRIKNGEIDKFRDPFIQSQRDAKRELYTVIISVVCICLLAGCFCLCFTYRYVVMPYLSASMKRSRSDPELSSLKADADSEKAV